MSELELFSALNEASAAVDSNFEFWLTSSFAVLVAAHFARRSLTPFFRNTILGLYLASTLLFTIRLMVNGNNHNTVLSRLESMGSDISTLTEASNNMLGLLYMCIIVLGTAATTVFILRQTTAESDEVDT